MRKKIIIVVIGILALIGIGILAWFGESKDAEPLHEAVTEIEERSSVRTIGMSVEGRLIEAHTYGTGEDHLLFVGGIHGGYEWNSTILAYRFIDHLKANPETVTSNLKITVVPNSNPDGTYKIIGKEGRFGIADVLAGVDTAAGRFNANNVDLNRNFDCKWQPESSWRGNIVSAGTAPFSEPEARALRDLVLETNPDAVVFWHSQASAVYASECEAGILPETLTFMNAYALASGYQPITIFDAYPITGDAEGWLAKINIPAITVELRTHETVEWEENLAGIEALLNYYRLQ